MIIDENILDLLRENKHGPALQLWLESDTDRSAIAQALKGNTSVSTVSVFVDEYFEEAPFQELVDLFSSIGTLPLQYFYLYSFGQSYDVFPVHLLTAIVNRASHLETITMYFVELGGGIADMNDLGESLKQHSSLKEFRLENSRVSDEVLASNSFDGVISAVAQLPNIENVGFFAKEKKLLGDISAGSLESFQYARNLTSLSLLNFELDNMHVSALGTALKTNSILEELSISCGPTCSGSLLEMIATNTTLTHLYLQLDTLDDDFFVQEVIVKGLETNSSLKRVELRNESSVNMSYASQLSCVAMLEKNYTLEYLNAYLSDDDVRYKADFFLKINQIGKRDIMRNPDTPFLALMRALAFVSDDLDMLFYLLVNRPCLFKR